MKYTNSVNAMASSSSQRIVFVSPSGNDRSSGVTPDPTDRANGPLATIQAAVARAKHLAHAGRLEHPAEVVLLSGDYVLDRPLQMHDIDFALVVRPRDGDTVLITGGDRIDGWADDRINGIACWSAPVPRGRFPDDAFRSLFVNGGRRTRACYPARAGDPREQQFFRMRGVPGQADAVDLFAGTNCFLADPADLAHVTDWDSVEVVALHLWTESRLPVASVDRQSGLVRSTHWSRLALKDDFGLLWARYYLDNVRVALREPGQWYLDRAAQRVYYVPLPGESLDRVGAVAPRLRTLVSIQNCVGVEFRGLRLAHADWSLVDETSDVIPHNPPPAGRPLGGAAQAEAHLPGAIMLARSRNCAVVDCTIELVGFYAIEMRPGCANNRVVRNTVRFVGAGGVKIDGADVDGPSELRSCGNVVSDNHMHDLGEVFHAGVGVLVMRASATRVAYNHVHDLFYSPISVGWCWQFRTNPATDNVVEFNHLHDYGRRWLADFGGIYHLGVAPGTVIRNNFIHDAQASTYGAWGIYLDESSSHVLVEDNVCVRFEGPGFNCHFGRENVVRNNVFAFGQRDQIGVGRSLGSPAVTFMRNIVIAEAGPFFAGGYAASVHRPDWIVSDLNLFWRQGSADGPFACDPPFIGTAPLDLLAWQRLGNDLHSVVADPKLAGIATGDVRLADDSPALRLGFRHIDLSAVGPRLHRTSTE